MNEAPHLYLILTLLLAAVIVVALFRKMHASPVLGYLVAGAIIGPGGFGFVSDIDTIQQIAEFGVVFLLFIIGLELSWERLRSMRRYLFVVAFAQVFITSMILAAGLHIAGVSIKEAVVIGGALALSSTALVMQILESKGQTASQLGRLALAMLLVQDLAAVPLLVLVPAFANPEVSLAHELFVLSGKAILALGAIVIIGRLMLGRLYRAVASLDTPEIFTAFTLLLVIGTGFVTHAAGLSLPLGAFMAGLLMAETEYRHQVEADVQPYKGLFLGLFFMATGMSVDSAVLLQKLPLIITLAIGLMALKAIVIIFLCKLFKVGFSVALQAGLLLAQGGEFAFIVFRLAAHHSLLPDEWAQIITIAVTLTMALTPLGMMIGNVFTRRSEHRRKRGGDDLNAEITDIKNHVIILGFGRVGQTIAKLLSAENIPYIAIETQVETVLRARKIGLPVYYGDGARREMLHALGLDRARAAIITLNDAAAAERAIHSIRAAGSSLPLIARARDLKDVLALEAAGANVAVSEMFEASLQLGSALLRSLGVVDHEINRINELFRDSDYALARGTLEVKPGEQRVAYGAKTEQTPQADGESISQGIDI